MLLALLISRLAVATAAAAAAIAADTRDGPCREVGVGLLDSIARVVLESHEKVVCESVEGHRDAGAAATSTRGHAVGSSLPSVKVTIVIVVARSLAVASACSSSSSCEGCLRIPEELTDCTELLVDLVPPGEAFHGVGGECCSVGGGVSHLHVKVERMRSVGCLCMMEQTRDEAASGDDGSARIRHASAGAATGNAVCCDRAGLGLRQDGGRGLRRCIIVNSCKSKKDHTHHHRRRLALQRREWRERTRSIQSSRTPRSARSSRQPTRIQMGREVSERSQSRRGIRVVGWVVICVVTGNLDLDALGH